MHNQRKELASCFFVFVVCRSINHRIAHLRDRCVTRLVHPKLVSYTAPTAPPTPTQTIMRGLATPLAFITFCATLLYWGGAWPALCALATSLIVGWLGRKFFLNKR